MTIVGLPSWSLVNVLYGAASVVATALLNGLLFVARVSGSEVSVYDTNSFQLQRQITIPGFASNIYGLATSSINGTFLYVAGYQCWCVNRVDLSVTSSVSAVFWYVLYPPAALSVTGNGNVLVTFFNNVVVEYTPAGSLVRQLPDPSNNLWQAIEVNSGEWMLSRVGPVHEIAMIATNGTVMKNLGSVVGSGMAAMSSPRCMAIDTNGYIIVADHGNNRILVVNPTMTVARQLPLPSSTALQSPITVHIEQSRGRLYIGEDGGQNRLLVFGKI